MTDVQLDKIYLQYAKDGRTQTTLMVLFGNYRGRHDFVLGDDSATWTVNTTQTCTANSTCKITTTTAEEAVLIKPLSDLTWIVQTASTIFTIDGDTYKITFSQP